MSLAIAAGPILFAAPRRELCQTSPARPGMLRGSSEAASSTAAHAGHCPEPVPTARILRPRLCIGVALDAAPGHKAKEQMLKSISW